MGGRTGLPRAGVSTRPLRRNGRGSWPRPSTGLTWPESSGRGGALHAPAIFTRGERPGRDPRAHRLIGLGMAGPTHHRARHRRAEVRTPSEDPSGERCGVRASRAGSARTSRSLRTKRSSTATRSSSTGRRCGPRSAHIADYCICWCEPIPQAPKHKGSRTCSSTCTRRRGGAAASSYHGDPEFNENLLQRRRCRERTCSARSTRVARRDDDSSSRARHARLLPYRAARVMVRKLVQPRRRRASTGTLRRRTLCSVTGSPSTGSPAGLRFTNYTGADEARADGCAGPEGSSKLHWSETNQRLGKLALEILGPAAQLDAEGARGNGFWQYHQLVAGGTRSRPDLRGAPKHHRGARPRPPQEQINNGLCLHRRARDLRSQARSFLEEKFPIDRVARSRPMTTLAATVVGGARRARLGGAFGARERRRRRMSFLEESVCSRRTGRALYPGPFFSTIGLTLPLLSGSSCNRSCRRAHGDARLGRALFAVRARACGPAQHEGGTRQRRLDHHRREATWSLGGHGGAVLVTATAAEGTGYGHRPGCGRRLGDQALDDGRNPCSGRLELAVASGEVVVEPGAAGDALRDVRTQLLPRWRRGRWRRVQGTRAGWSTSVAQAVRQADRVVQGRLPSVRRHVCRDGARPVARVLGRMVWSPTARTMRRGGGRRKGVRVEAAVAACERAISGTRRHRVTGSTLCHLYYKRAQWIDSFEGFGSTRTAHRRSLPARRSTGRPSPSLSARSGRSCVVTTQKRPATQAGHSRNEIAIGESAARLILLAMGAGVVPGQLEDLLRAGAGALRRTDNPLTRVRVGNRPRRPDRKGPVPSRAIERAIPDVEIITDVETGEIDERTAVRIEAFAQHRLSVREASEIASVRAAVRNVPTRVGSSTRSSTSRPVGANIHAVCRPPDAQPLVLLHGSRATKCRGFRLCRTLRAVPGPSDRSPRLRSSSKPLGAYDAAWFADHVFIFSTGSTTSALSLPATRWGVASR